MNTSKFVRLLLVSISDKGYSIYIMYSKENLMGKDYFEKARDFS